MVTSQSEQDKPFFLRKKTEKPKTKTDPDRKPTFAQKTDPDRSQKVKTAGLYFKVPHYRKPNMQINERPYIFKCQIVYNFRKCLPLYLSVTFFSKPIFLEALCMRYFTQTGGITSLGVFSDAFPGQKMFFLIFLEMKGFLVFFVACLNENVQTIMQ
jgi:hypothetical protein